MQNSLHEECSKESASTVSIIFGVRCESRLVACTIQDIKTAYGRMRFQVAPVNGSGSMWVEDSRLVGLVDLLGLSL